MPEAQAPYYSLQLRTCDELNAFLQPNKGLQALFVDVTLAYCPAVAKLKFLDRLTITIAGCSRLCAVLSIAPVTQKMETVVYLADAGPRDSSPSLGAIARAWMGEIEMPATEKLKRDIQALTELLERRSTTESLAYSGAANAGTN